MRIVDIREICGPLKGNVSNGLGNFSEHTVSLGGGCSDVVRNGKPVVGVAFNSIGRFAQRGLLHERLIPRILKCTPESLLESDGRTFSAKAIFRAAMTNEQLGGLHKQGQSLSMRLGGITTRKIPQIACAVSFRRTATLVLSTSRSRSV